MNKIKLLISLILFGFLSIGWNPAYAATVGYVRADVNMRTGAGVRYRVKAVVPSGARITVYRCELRWCRVSWRGTRGWVSRRYIVISSRYRSRRRVYPPLYDPYYDDPFYDPPVIFYPRPRIRNPRSTRPRHRRPRQGHRRPPRPRQIRPGPRPPRHVHPRQRNPRRIRPEQRYPDVTEPKRGQPRVLRPQHRGAPVTIPDNLGR